MSYSFILIFKSCARHEEGYCIMRKYIIFFICCFCVINIFARIPSVQEAQRHLNLNTCGTAIYADSLQARAVRKKIYDRYFVKLTGVPNSAEPVYSSDDNRYVSSFNDLRDASDLTKITRYFGLDCNADAYANLSLVGRYQAPYDLQYLQKILAEKYVSAHIINYKELQGYIYTFTVTIYVTKGTTGQTYVHSNNYETILYDGNKFWGYTGLPGVSDQHSQSWRKTVDYICEVYTPCELASILGIKDAIKSQIYRKEERDISFKLSTKEFADIFNEKIANAGPILPHNPAIEDKYNKNMFGDISAQLRNMPSSSIQSPSYPGGDYAISSYVQRNLKYPASLEKDGIDESVSYTITVGANGTVKNVEADQYGLNYDLKNQTIQLLKKLPKRFTPANGYGQNVESTYSVDINYHLDPILTIDEPSLSYTNQGGEHVVRVTSKRDWTFTSPATSGIKVRKDGNRLVITCPERNKKDIESLNDKIIIKIPGTNYSYDITIRQDGAPKPYITPSQTQVNLPRKKKDARYIVTVESNRDWKVQAKNPESKINMHRVDSRLIFTAPTNNSKQNRDATFTLVSTNKDCQKDIVVTQFGRDADKYTSSGTKHSSSFLELYEDYYDNYGSFELGLVDLQVGAGCTMPLFSVENGEKVLTTEPYFPLNFEVCYLRFHFVELSLLNFRLDLSTDGKEGFAWEPQIRGLIPVSERWALMPYVGPVCQINTDGNEKSVWSASGGLMARVRYGKVTHTNFSIGYKGGPCGGLAIGVSIGWSLGW